MPPKAEKKKQQKVIQDRTFGLKNKNKSKAVQKFVKGVENTVKNSGKSANALESQKFERQKQKKKQQEQLALLNSLYKDVRTMKAQQEQEQQDPKNIVCPYFKQGLCQKGKKCIYSHDLTLDRTEEIDLYVDQRTQLIMNQIGKDINELTQEELGKLITDKEKQYIKGAKSDIVCKFFLEAVEKGKYGWNWTCANGGDRCKYKHCLPPGYVLNKDGGQTKIQMEEVNIQQKIDQERNKLISQNKNKSPLVTYQIFLKWKQSKIHKKKQQEQKKKKQEQKKNKNKGGGNLRTGKELFTYDPTLFIDDQEAAADYEERQQIVQQEEQVDEQKKKLRQGDEGQEEQGEGQNQQKQEQPQKVQQSQTHHENGQSTEQHS